MAATRLLLIGVLAVLLAVAVTPSVAPLPARPPRPPPPPPFTPFCELTSDTQRCCKGDQCSCPNNFGNFANDCTNKDNKTLGCNIEPKWCNCTESAYNAGPWKLKYPLQNNYLGTYEGQSQMNQPYIYGILSRKACCATCALGNKQSNADKDAKRPAFRCAYWLHFVPPGMNQLVATPGSGSSCSNGASAEACGYCLIYPPGTSPESWDGCETGTCGNGFAANISTVGKGCTNAANDPHFVGAHGTHFDFNGVPDESFCLLTDPAFQVNMKMRGYYDTRTVGASQLRNGMAVRTWIKDLGIVWKDRHTGVVHRFKMSARFGKAIAREEGYLKGMEMDGVALERMSVGETHTFEGGLTVQFVGYEKQGGGYFDVDAYNVAIKGVLEVEVKLRVAHPLLQTPTDAMTHININFLYVEHTPLTHGVLGQTFRGGREKRAMDYTMLSHLMGRDVAVDSELGKGFLDGTGADYKTTDVLASDCKYSAFNSGSLPL